MASGGHLVNRPVQTDLNPILTATREITRGGVSVPVWCTALLPTQMTSVDLYHACRPACGLHQFLIPVGGNVRRWLTPYHQESSPRDFLYPAGTMFAFSQFNIRPTRLRRTSRTWCRGQSRVRFLRRNRHHRAQWAQVGLSLSIHSVCRLHIDWLFWTQGHRLLISSSLSKFGGHPDTTSSSTIIWWQPLRTTSPIHGW